MPTTRLICVFEHLSLGACSGTVAASGETSDGETFSGTFSRRSDGIGGVVALRSDKGTNCEGRWQPAGTLKGMLGGKPFSGTFQDPARSITP